MTMSTVDPNLNPSPSPNRNKPNPLNLFLALTLALALTLIRDITQSLTLCTHLYTSIVVITY